MTADTGKALESLNTPGRAKKAVNFKVSDIVQVDTVTFRNPAQLIGCAWVKKGGCVDGYPKAHISRRSTTLEKPFEPLTPWGGLKKQ